MKKIFVAKVLCLLTVTLITTVAIYATPYCGPEPECQPIAIRPLDLLPPGTGGGGGKGGED